LEYIYSISQFINYIYNYINILINSAKGNPPASKRFISNLRTVKVDDKVKGIAICIYVYIYIYIYIKLYHYSSNSKTYLICIIYK